MHDDFHFILVIDFKLDFVNLVTYGLTHIPQSLV